jgi:putative restriction endonuclease
MLWLEMARDEVHGGGEWGFARCLWSPTRTRAGSRSGYWEMMRRVSEGDSILHLRGVGSGAAFVGISYAATAAAETKSRPPVVGEWSYAEAFYHVPLRDFSPLEPARLLDTVFEYRNDALRNYFESNRNSASKRRLFYVVQDGRLQCQNGAYLSEVDLQLAQLLLEPSSYEPSPNSSGMVTEVATGTAPRTILERLGQDEFSDNVRRNYGGKCAFPGCEISEQRFLRASHIARWADVPELRGRASNGLCLCLMHDAAFEAGLFTVTKELLIWVNPARAAGSAWAAAALYPRQGEHIRGAAEPPSLDALAHHWIRCKISIAEA